MNKKNTLKKMAAVAMVAALGLGATGCNFIITDNEADLNQTVATVNITSTLKADEAYKNVADDVMTILGDKTGEISKSELVSYFLSVGYQYVQSYGYTYEDTFKMLLDGLVSREIMIQYATAHYLAEGAKDGSIGLKDYNDFVAKQHEALEKSTEEGAEKELALLKKHPEILAFKYFLTDGGEGSTEDYDRTVYTLKKSLNDSLDSMEGEFIKASTDAETTEDKVQTLPTGVGTEKEDYYSVDYDVYTGRNTLDSCKPYEKLDGSTTSTRRSAYNRFLANLQANNFINMNGDEVEDTADITHIDYYYVELSSSLGQALITKYLDDLEAELGDKMKTEYIKGKYASIYLEQMLSYKNSPSAFETALGSVSDDSFVLYGLQDFGFVYNILIPFSPAQEVQYTQYKNMGLTANDLYLKRKELLKGVKGEDLRDSWITTGKTSNYSYEKDGKYYFFEDNFTNEDKYEKLTHYANAYPYNGTVTENKEDDKYEFEPVKMSVDNVLDDMLALIEKLSGAKATENTSVKTAYENNVSYTNKKGEVEDYTKFIYRSGKVDLGTVRAADHFNPESTSYKALSAVNEMMFAYSTDTGCLNTYMGYVVSPYGTSFMKEFEAAAQWTIKNGVGSYAVCPTDYGWHIIYCSFKYTGENNGDVYGGYVAEADMPVGTNWEGTFSNLFYESLKTSMVNNSANEVQSTILNKYNNESSVTRYQKAYQDLLDMDKQ